MSETPYFPFYTGDFLRKTAHLTHQKRSMYVLLLLHQYAISGPFPVPFSARHGDLYRVTLGTTKRDRQAAREVLQEFFVLGPDGWWNPRAKSEILKQKEVSAKRSKSGKKGAKKRWQMPSNDDSKCQQFANGKPHGKTMARARDPDPDLKNRVTGFDVPVVNSRARAREDAGSSLDPETRSAAERLNAELEQRRESAGLSPGGPRRAAEVVTALRAEPGNPEPGVEEKKT